MLWPKPGLYIPCLGCEWAGQPPCLPSDTPGLVLAKAFCAGWVLASSPVGSAERPQAVIGLEDCIRVLGQSLFLCHKQKTCLFLQQLNEDLKGKG